MVVFCCNKCGESLKKNQVDKHNQTVCRGSCNVSCMDCQKDFIGNAYQTHTKCISEEEKYSAPGFVPKVNKGEVKQDLWIQQVHNAIKKSMNNPQLKSVLQRLLDFPNIPRKKQKFENFVSNSMRIRDKSLVTQVWDIMMAEKEEKTQTPPADAPVQKTDNSENSTEKEKEPVADMEEGVSEKKLSKRERKEARRKKQNKVEKKEKRVETQGEANEEEEDHQIKKKKSKKRKREEMEEEEEAEGTEVPQLQNGHKKKKVPATEEEEECFREGKKKKKQKERAEENGVVGDQMKNGEGKKRKKNKKKKRSPPEEQEAMDTSAADETMRNGGGDDDECENGKDDDEGAPDTAKSHRKIRVEEVVVKILQSKGELPVKKLRKKVLQEFAAEGAMSKSREAVWAKVEKKLKKNPRFKLHKDRVKLVH